MSQLNDLCSLNSQFVTLVQESLDGEYLLLDGPQARLDNGVALSLEKKPKYSTNYGESSEIVFAGSILEPRQDDSS
jgi:hypothetical protein